MGLKPKVEGAAKTYSNRAAAYLELGMYMEALRDADESLNKDPSEKAFYRKGRAAYAMRQYSTAAESYRACLKLNEKNKQASDELRRCEERLRESQTGQYNVKRLLGCIGAGEIRLDVADYTARSIGVEPIEGKSKGVVAVEDIKRGTLLVGAKAASIAYDRECTIKVVSVNFYTKKIDQPSNNQNLVNLFYKVQHDPYLAKKVC